MINLQEKMAALSEQERERAFKMICRQSLSAFIQKGFGIVSPGDQYKHNWHIDLIADRLEKCATGEITRLLITVPPRYGKSICVSVAFNAWLLGHNPHAKIIGVSYGSELAEKHSQDCKKLMTSNFYRALFPGTRLSQNENTKAYFKTGHGGFRMATSVGGSLTGLGGDYLIIDDPIKPQDALSDTQRNHLNSWYDNTLYTRLNDKQNGCIILVLQRVHEDDLAGHVLEQEDWVHLNLPAIAEEDEEHLIHPFTGDSLVVERDEGEALHPEREPITKLNNLKATQLGSYNFAAQYQQRPAPLEGGLVKWNWFKRYKHLPENPGTIIQSWDTANKAGINNDYSVCTTWFVYDRKMYLVEIFRERLEFPPLKRAVEKQYQKYKPARVVIEDSGVGTGLIQELDFSGVPIVPNTPKGDKATRIYNQTGQIEAGNVLLPEEAEWLDDLKDEITRFPNGRHDDQVDSISQAIDEIINGTPAFSEGVD